MKRIGIIGCLIALAAAGDVCRSSAADDPANQVSSERTFTRQEREHWAFQPVRRPAVPGVRNAAWVRTPIDTFVLEKLEQVGLSPAPPADRRALLRRVYLDLIGLPPTPEEQRAFLADDKPDAFEKVVDGLLARPQYGERWARHWLDVARYAESNGYERDGAKPHAWRYRDYVINSLNADKPYDRFVIEQLAGDEIEGSNAETQIATTFLRLGTWDDEPADPLPDRYDQLDDVLGTTATAFLGLTLRCARCHDHKFEPFSQNDYYRGLAIFEPLKRPEIIVSATHRKEHDIHVGTEAELAVYREATAKADAEVAVLQKQIDELKMLIRDRLFEPPLPVGEGRGEGKKSEIDSPGQGENKAARVETKGPHPNPLPEGEGTPKPSKTTLPADAVMAFQTEPEKRTAQQKELVKKFSDKLEQEIREAANTDERARREQSEKQIAAIDAARLAEPPRAYIWHEDTPAAPATRLFKRGDPRTPLGEFAPGLPTVLAQYPLDPPKPTGKSTGRRLWLAHWMTRPDNPLVARVMANRIWQHHFGEGLVASENDFGIQGDRPSHSELLDWLAAEFMAGGWRMKPLHRVIVLSNTYQQASRNAELGLRNVESASGNQQSAISNQQSNPQSLDPDNRLLWHWRQRRVEAEVARDSALAVSGQLNLETGGPSVYPTLPRAVLEGQSRPGEGWGKSDERQSARRSVYIFVKRVLAVPELDLPDAPDNTSSCEQRAVSTVAPQALTFLNGEFINQQARHFAARLVREAGSDAKTQIELAFELTLCRPPRPEERHAAIDFLPAQQRQIEADARAAEKEAGDSRQKALEAFCLVLLNTNEFFYPE